MFDGGLSFSVLQAAYVAVCYCTCIVIIYVCSKFSFTYIANPFRLCVASLSLITISGILLTMSGRLCLRHFSANSCLALKVCNSFFYSGVVCMYVILGD